MLITCPSCASAYDLPVGRIGPSGRKVRCASCRESWFVASPEDNSEPGPSLEVDTAATTEIVTRPLPPPEPKRQPEATETRRRPGGRRKTPKDAGGARKRGIGLDRLGRIAAVVAVCATVPGLLAFREKVVSALPGTASLYRHVGLPVNLVGLSLVGLRSSLSQDGETPVLEVSGEIVNDGRAARTVPLLQIALEGDRGERLYRWSAKAAEGELQVGQSAPFRVRLTAPPPGARAVEVTFRDGERRLATQD